MKQIFAYLLSLFISATSYAQVVTGFFGKVVVQADGYSVSLVEIQVYEHSTAVTVQIVPNKYKSRINYFSSRNTVIDCGSGVELPIVGFLKGDLVETAPFSGTWGWSNVKKGDVLKYTMVFNGRVPGGVTRVSIRDKGDSSGRRGFSFSNLSINNPDPCEHTGLTESRIRSMAEDNNDGIVGIYEGYSNDKYKIGVIKFGNTYKMVYLDGAKNYPWWHVGDVKAILKTTATAGLYKADWYMLNKSIESNTFVVFDGSGMKIKIGDQEENGYIKMYPTTTPKDNHTEWSGTGFALNNGYIVTNYHVVDGAKSIIVHGVNGNSSSDYSASVVATDTKNDLAIIKIADSRFSGFGTIPYAIKNQMAEMGEQVWVLGYPLTQYLGNEIKLTTGIVSSRSGYQDDVSTYQISAPVQPGNSGGPLIDSKGYIVGVVNAGVPGADNVGYAIKTSYLRNLLDSFSLTSSLPNSNSISSLSLTDQVKEVRNFVFLLMCSSKGRSSQSSSVSSEKNISQNKPSSGSTTNKQSSSPNTTNNDSAKPTRKTDVSSVTITNLTGAKADRTSLRITQIRIQDSQTIIDFEFNNDKPDGGYFEYAQVERSATIIVDGQSYNMTKVGGIKVAPEKTYFSRPHETIKFKLYFPPINKEANKLDFIESPSSSWIIRNVVLQ